MREFLYQQPSAIARAHARAVSPVLVGSFGELNFYFGRKLVRL